ncbi:hypothetical protein R1flu_025116 [Riccia fluitans]|uniref:Peroxidase n=1 Tax=Riccia fluitans TaxID=41844 RepID=A0ABD1XX95_9MARC
MAIRWVAGFVLVVFTGLILTSPPVRGQLTPDYYESCPYLESTVKSIVESAVDNETRLAASLLRLHFHDCFVDGCDGSVLLDDTDTFTGEKNALPNANSIRGFQVIDDIKSALEEIEGCQGVVSCADILTIAARDAVVKAGGPTWTVELGRYDSLTASKENAEAFLPSPFSDVPTLNTKFADVGLNETDLVTLSGGHTFGKAQCGGFSFRLYNFSGTGAPDPTINSTYLSILQESCPDGGDASVLNDLDQGTPNAFDNSYFSNLVINKGLLRSDQVLESTDGSSTQDLVSAFANDQSTFFSQFVISMLKMSAISPKNESQGEIRTNCHFVNSAPSPTSLLVATA